MRENESLIREFVNVIWIINKLTNEKNHSEVIKNNLTSTGEM